MAEPPPFSPTVGLLTVSRAWEAAFSDALMPTENDAISVVHPQPVCPDFEQLLADLRNAAENNDDEATLNVLRAAIPEYRTVPVEACAPSPYPDWY